jgi:hypothetical protein
LLEARRGVSLGRAPSLARKLRQLPAGIVSSATAPAAPKPGRFLTWLQLFFTLPMVNAG